MTDELKLKLIQQYLITYYESGGAELPSEYKSAVLDMLDVIVRSEIETAEERMVKNELITNYAIETNAKENNND